MALTDVNLFRIDGTLGSIPSADIDVVKHSASASNNIVLNSDGTTTLTPSNIIKSGTAQASTSGTAIDFTGIPSWVKRITVMFNGVSTNGTSLKRIQIGDSGGIETSGYSSTGATIYSTTAATTTSSASFTIYSDLAADSFSGCVVIVNVTGNTWVASGTLTVSSNANNPSVIVNGAKTLSDTLTQVRITTSNGTDAFDAGTINILYEG